MDPLSITASIIAILDLTTKAIQYLGDVKDAPKARASLAIEASNLYSLLMNLRYRLEEGRSNEAWYTAVRSLGVQGGPLDQYKDMLERIQHKLGGGGSWIKEVGQSLVWKFSKEEVRGLFVSMEGLKGLIAVALEMDHFKLSQAIKSAVDCQGRELSLQIDGLAQDFRDEKFMREQESIDGLHHELCGWLSPCNPEMLHLKACGHHHSGTSGWFLEGSLKWLVQNKSDSSAILLLKGTSGTGKSTLMSQAIKQAKSDVGQDPVLYFYCSFDDQATQDPVNILASFIVQLSHQVPELLDDFMPEYLKAKQHSTPAQLSIEQLEKIFMAHTRSLPHVFLFLDAVNECQDASAISDLLVRLALRCSNLRMLITSTRELNNPEPSGTLQTLVVQMDSSSVTKDISIFVDDMLALDQGLRNVTMELKADIRSTVISNSDGMFRYARWLMNHLAEQRTGRAIRKALTEMPTSLNEMYAMLLNRIPKSSPDRELLRRCLVWLSFSTRPLRLAELAEAVILEDTSENVDSDDRLHSPEILLDISQGLFEVDGNSGRVALAHSSVKTFLLSKWIQNTSVADFSMDDAKGHGEIIRLCLTYLTLSGFISGWGETMEVTETRFKEYPLLEYAVENWLGHSKIANYEFQMWSKVTENTSSHHLNLGMRTLEWWAGYHWGRSNF
ncbi:hypothetical protein VE01_05654 [Pseudogymnoascus verrucosus]|uniref:NACHT domain-containing protein n=1 Tax=Pseudogymnoascus verrucosus TaxID=342668 RepID=A0A1B8GKW1_9PEZI|nr:uncharacterized protein VE01_05654 [Pseudogymnoascus verrucosus]OBT96480.2 hypothetical protein VE01_05654 [Pseudogymnoascus verrucosus]